jgi:hypothetical protein
MAECTSQRTTEELRVKLAADGYCPQIFWWQGRRYRVLALESVHTLGSERRYGLGTAEGHFELAVDTGSAQWRMRRAPGWLGRVWAQWHYGARYPLPSWRRRVYRPISARREGSNMINACGRLDVQPAKV